MAATLSLEDLPGRRRVAEAGTPIVAGAPPARRPSASAIRSTCISAANSIWGAPNPRKAPFGGVFVAIARARIRTFGQA